MLIIGYSWELPLLMKLFSEDEEEQESQHEETLAEVDE